MASKADLKALEDRIKKGFLKVKADQDKIKADVKADISAVAASKKDDTPGGATTGGRDEETAQGLLELTNKFKAFQDEAKSALEEMQIASATA